MSRFWRWLMFFAQDRLYAGTPYWCVRLSIEEMERGRSEYGWIIKCPKCGG